MSLNEFQCKSEITQAKNRAVCPAYRVPLLQGTVVKTTVKKFLTFTIKAYVSSSVST